LNRKFFRFELNGESVLGFDTGLDAKAFAKAKMAQFIIYPGFIVYPDGTVETWQPGGVAEQETMLIWGPFFPGEPLEEILNDAGRKDEALDALRFWLRAQEALQSGPLCGPQSIPGGKEPPYPGPAAACIVTGQQQGTFPAGTVFFPPARLLKRYLEGAEAERWIHLDLQGAEAVSFSAAAMLYRVFCGVPPFAKDNLDELRQDIREGVFTPPALAAPGLDPELAALISRAMSCGKEGRPAPEDLSACLGPVPRPVSSWFRPLTEEERSRLRAEQEHYSSRKTRAVKTRRFMSRNTALLAGAAVAVVLVFLSILGINRHLAEQPNTRGMSPVEVIDAYYAAFSALDPIMMRACVTGRAGRRDIEMVANLFAVSRIRQAFEIELGQAAFFPAQQWLDAGQPFTEQIVFGITDLSIRELSRTETSARFEAEYTLWMPGAFFVEDGETPALEDMPPPGSLAFRDRLYLALHRGAWRITEIYRTGDSYF